MKLSLQSFLAFACLASFALAQDEEKQIPEPKTRTLPEAKAEFSGVDKQLNAIYSKAKKTLPEYEFEKLRDDQRTWLEYRDHRTLLGLQFDHGINLTEGIHDEGVDGAKARELAKMKAQRSPHYWEWLTALTETRVEILKGWLGVGDPDSLTGRYIDGYGGYMIISEKEGMLHFHIESVRGHSYHTGSIGGVAQLNQSMGRFTDQKDAEKEKLKRDGETWLTFVDRSSTGRWVEVIGTNTQYYHGARAYFDGKYVRVGVLDAKAKAELEEGSAAEEDVSVDDSVEDE